MAYDKLQREPSELVAGLYRAHRHGLLGPPVLLGMVPQPWDSVGPSGIRAGQCAVRVSCYRPLRPG